MNQLLDLRRIHVLDRAARVKVEVVVHEGHHRRGPIREITIPMDMETEMQFVCLSISRRTVNEPEMAVNPAANRVDDRAEDIRVDRVREITMKTATVNGTEWVMVIRNSTKNNVHRWTFLVAVP